MKKILFILMVSVLLVNCKNDAPLTDAEIMNQYVNKWIYDNMDQLYYWNTSLPVYQSTTGNPADYFKTLKNSEDRFSAIFESYQDILNQLNGVSTGDIGFEFQLYLESSTNNNVIGIITYPKPGTTAASLGIKRGFMFRKINGQQMTTTNYSTLLNYLYDNSASASITFSNYVNNAFVDLAPVTINKAVNYKEDPVYMDTVYTVQSKKVGYLVYNFFAGDSGDKSLQYDLELNNAIGNFKQANISELIIDLRYNHGGAMNSAVNLGSMLVPNPVTNKVFVYTAFNQNYTDYFNSSAYKSQYSDNPFESDFATSITSSTQTYPVQNVGSNLQRIFFLTSNGTASASEMVINGLKPFLPCVLIGDTTVGKNVGSTLIHDTDNAKNQWAFMPIILKYFNKDYKSDFTKGFAPDFRVDDDYNYQLGDTREAMLGKAIAQISGLQGVISKSVAVKKPFLQTGIKVLPLRSGLIIKSKAVDSYLLNKKKN